MLQDTGVMEMRQALEDKEDAKSLKQKTKERVRPKMGKLTIDYQKLHDAFFKWQTKPKMSIHGDLYYEVKSSFYCLLLFRSGCCCCCCCCHSSLTCVSFRVKNLRLA